MADSLELRLERIKRLSNLRLQLLKSCYHRRCIVERNIGGEAVLHFHYLVGEKRFFCTWKKRNIDFGSDVGEVPVFVWI